MERSNVPRCTVVFLVVSETSTHIHPDLHLPLRPPQSVHRSRVNKSILDHHLASCDLHYEAALFILYINRVCNKATISSESLPVAIYHHTTALSQRIRTIGSGEEGLLPTPSREEGLSVSLPQKSAR